MPEASPLPDDRYRPLRRTGGVAILVGVLGLLIQQILDTRLPPGPSGAGDIDGFVARATHPVWVPYQTSELLGVLLITLGLFFLYRDLFDRGEVQLTIAWMFAAGLAAGTRLVEFALGVIAFPDIISSFGSGLSKAQLDVLVQGYRALGGGLLVIIAVFTGIAMALLGTALYRARLIHPSIGGVGIVLGVYLIITELVPPSLVTFGPLDAVSTVLLWLWFVAVGISMFRAAPESG